MESLGQADEVRVTPYVLPHHSRLTTAQHSAAGGPGGRDAQQGFYVYRNRRLLLPGDWLGLEFRKEEHYKLARIRVDLSNSSTMSGPSMSGSREPDLHCASGMTCCGLRGRPDGVPSRCTGTAARPSLAVRRERQHSYGRGPRGVGGYPMWSTGTIPWLEML